MWKFLFLGAGYGFTAAVQPGPFQTYLISQTLRRGWQRTLPAAFAPLISDGPIILLCLFVLSQVPLWLQRALSLAGGLFILYLARGALAAWRNFALHLPVQESGSRQSLWSAALMNGLSPGPYLFWSLVTGPILLDAWRQTSTYGIGFLGGFYAAIVSTLLVLVLVFGLAARAGPRMTRALLGLSAIVLFCFGLYQVGQGLLGAV